MLETLRHLLKLESASGFLLVSAAVLAMIAANSRRAGAAGARVMPVSLRRLRAVLPGKAAGNG
ncbi:MAG: hypothetical protein WBN34_00710 [Woeseia sp.]